MTAQLDEASLAIPSLRPLAISWLVVSVPVAAASFMLALASDRPEDVVPGLVLSLLTLVGIALPTWMLARPTQVALTASLAASTVWLIAGAIVYPLQDFVADAVWSGGAPVVGALITLSVAMRARRATDLA